MKTLITHINPHLDDIAAIWLIRKFFPEWETAKVEFISADKGKGGLSETADTIFIGVGKGRFDEHKKGGEEDTSMSLVWEDIQKNNLVKDEFEIKAIDEMVEWNNLIDHAKMEVGKYYLMEVYSFIRSSASTDEDSLKTVELGLQILDRILPLEVQKQRGLSDWDKRVEWDSQQFGHVVAIETEDFPRRMAPAMGADVFIQRSPKDDFVGVTADGNSKFDLTPIYEKLKELDPKAGWFLHQSKKMILCGSESAPDVVRSKLSLQEIVEVIKSLG